LDRHFSNWKIGGALVSDLTYIRTNKGWMYYTTVIDLYDRKIIGWACSTTMKAMDTTIPALKMALGNRKIRTGAIFHSDRGVQYASMEFTSLLLNKKLSPSMSRKGNCWDNAVAESFFKTLKQECTNRYNFKDKEQAALEIFDYVETWYNTKRIHLANNQKSINEMEIKKINNQLAA
jgi:transposase InsO family protein